LEGGSLPDSLWRDVETRGNPFPTWEELHKGKRGQQRGGGLQTEGRKETKRRKDPIMSKEDVRAILEPRERERMKVCEGGKEFD